MPQALSPWRHRFRQGQYFTNAVSLNTAFAGFMLQLRYLVLYDDGTYDEPTDQVSLAFTGNQFTSVIKPLRAKKDGYVLDVSAYVSNQGTTAANVPRGTLYVWMYVSDAPQDTIYDTLAQGWVYRDVNTAHTLKIDENVEQGFDATWVFQGTIIEDATAGTHVCSLTVTPGAGNEMTVQYARKVGGNTATSQTEEFFVDDGTNKLYEMWNLADTAALVVRNWPFMTAPATNTNIFGANSGPGLIVSGVERVILRTTTTAVSVTQTFAVTCRIKGAIPTATLADTVGAPTLTTNTSAVFG